MTRSGKRPAQTAYPSPYGSVPAEKPASSHEPLTPVIFKGSGGYIVTGPESHQVYCFSSHDPELMIDARDAEALLETGLFHVGE